MKRLNDTELETMTIEALNTLPEEARHYGAGEVKAILNDKGYTVSLDRVQLAIKAYEARQYEEETRRYQNGELVQGYEETSTILTSEMEIDTMDKGYTILSGGKVIVISERGQTTHETTKFLDAVAQHINMTRANGEQWLEITIENLDVFAYNRPAKDARHFKNLRLANGEMRWEHTLSLDYATLEEKRIDNK